MQGEWTVPCRCLSSMSYAVQYPGSSRIGSVAGPSERQHDRDNRRHPAPSLGPVGNPSVAGLPGRTGSLSRPVASGVAPFAHGLGPHQLGEEDRTTRARGGGSESPGPAARPMPREHRGAEVDSEPKGQGSRAIRDGASLGDPVGPSRRSRGAQKASVDPWATRDRGRDPRHPAAGFQPSWTAAASPAASAAASAAASRELGEPGARPVRGEGVGPRGPGADWPGGTPADPGAAGAPGGVVGAAGSVGAAGAAGSVGAVGSVGSADSVYGSFVAPSARGTSGAGLSGLALLDYDRLIDRLWAQEFLQSGGNATMEEHMDRSYYMLPPPEEVPGGIVVQPLVRRELRAQAETRLADLAAPPGGQRHQLPQWARFLESPPGQALAVEVRRRFTRPLLVAEGRPFRQPLQGRPGAEVRCEHRFASATTIGGRDYQEDRFALCLAAHPLNTVVATVLDGHSGGEMSHWLSENLPAIALRALRPEVLRKRRRDPVAPMLEALRRAWVATDQRMHREHPKWDCGSTASMALVHGSKVILSTLGDSRAMVFGEDGVVYAATVDHKPDTPDEQRRIEASGGFVSVGRSGVPRVQGELNMSRSFGDYSFKMCHHESAGRTHSRYHATKGPVSSEPTFSCIDLASAFPMGATLPTKVMRPRRTTTKDRGRKATSAAATAASAPGAGEPGEDEEEEEEEEEAGRIGETPREGGTVAEEPRTPELTAAETQKPLPKQRYFVLVASDGVTDGFSGNGELVAAFLERFRSTDDLRGALCSVMERALVRSTDNATCLVGQLFIDSLRARSSY